MEDNQKKGKKISTTVLKDEDFYNRQKSDQKDHPHWRLRS